MIGARWSGIATSGWLQYRLDSRTCVFRREFPRNREIGVRLIAAEGARPDASRKDVSQPGIALRDSFQYRLDRLSHALAGSFRR